MKKILNRYTDQVIHSGDFETIKELLDDGSLDWWYENKQFVISCYENCCK